MAFTFLNGCRRMEVIGLRWTSVDFLSRTFHVLGKGGKERTIPMTDRSHQSWGSARPAPGVGVRLRGQADRAMGDGRRFRRGERYPLTEADFKTAARRAIARSGVTDFRLHDIGHTTGIEGK